MYRGERITAVIQARMGSTRLPNKVLMTLGDRPVIWHVIQRLKTVELIDDIIVATSTRRRDNPLAAYIEQFDDSRVELFRGPEEDVLQRFYLALQSHADPPHAVVRITGDSPLLSVRHLERMITHLIDNRLDGVDAHHRRTGLTLGFGTEVYHHQALVDAHLLAHRPEQREHVSLFIKQRPCAFRVEYPKPDPRLCSPFRLTLDYPQDYWLIERLYGALYQPGEIIDCTRALTWLGDRPDIAEVNADCNQIDPVQGASDAVAGP